MKTNIKMPQFKFLASIGLGIMIAMVSCKKNTPEAARIPEQKTEVLSIDDFVKDFGKIAKLGFDPFSIQVTPHGYLVEDDILLTKTNIEESLIALSKQQGQYSSRYPLSLERRIRVALFNPTNRAIFATALDSSLAEMNRLRIPLNFILEGDTARADIIVKFADLGGVSNGSVILGRAAEFVNAQGNPGKYILFNSNAGANLAGRSRAYLTGVLSHEFGHAIGLRHTDYRNRLYSSLRSRGVEPTLANLNEELIRIIRGIPAAVAQWDTLDTVAREQVLIQLRNASLVNEGELTGTISQANHIYGTPQSPIFGENITTDPLSLMLANINEANLRFSLYDNIAFFGLYGNPAQTAHIRASLGQFGNVTATGRTLQQVVNEVKALK